ncbi:unnamed protein product [Rhizophagus irregularis]|nr:unnamed protein product [Rhizophagus irregularis]
MIFNIPLLKSNILYEKVRKDMNVVVIINYQFSSVDPDWGHGFVHFENDDDKTRFYNYVRNKKFIGPLSKTIMFAEARPKGGDDDDYYDDDDDDDDDDDGRSNTQNQSLQSPVQPPLSQPSPQSSPLQLPPPQSPQSSPVQLPPPQSPQPSQSQLPAYNIFEVEINITITSLQYF